MGLIRRILGLFGLAEAGSAGASDPVPSIDPALPADKGSRTLSGPRVQFATPPDTAGEHKRPPAENTWPIEPPRLGHYPELDEPGRGLKNDVLSQMRRFRHGREPWPYCAFDDDAPEDDDE